MKNTVRLTIKEYAKKKKCSRQYVERLLHRGEIKFSKFGKQYVIEELPK